MTNPQDTIAATISAFIAKTCNVLVSAPLERSMTIIQTQGTIKNLQTPYKGVLNCLGRLYREEGFKHLWRGSSAAVLGNIPRVFLNFPLKDLFKNIFPQYSPKAQSWRFLATNILSGTCAGAASLIFSYPFDLIRIQLASDLGKEAKDRQFKGFKDCWKNIYQTDGIKGLYRGYALSCAGIMVYRGLYFGLYDGFKSIYLEKNISIFGKFMLAQCVTLTAGFATYPLDTLRRRLAMQGGRVEPDYWNAMDCIKKMVEREGMRSLFRGVLFRTGLNMSGSVALVVYDQLTASRRV